MIQEMLKRNPALLLLVFVYLWIIPRCLSYRNAWVEPEELRIKSYILKTGPDINIRDIANGLNWQAFEYKPRPTRPLSSYFEIIDTKFRCRLWHNFMPHPSLSLTWIFSLGLAPFFLCRLLKNLGASSNTALTLTAFYLATPGVLSCEAMLFRPAKPMANFFIIFCLYLASSMKKNFVDQDRPIPLRNFLTFLGTTASSFYWDETALLLLPAVLFIFPSVLRRKLHASLWLFLIPLTLIFYLGVIPVLSGLAGYEPPHLLKYDLLQSAFRSPAWHNFIIYLWSNAKNLILETMGVFPCSAGAPKPVLAFLWLAILSWLMILTLIFRTMRRFDPQIVFLALLVLLFNASLSVTMSVWGPYYYGSFWPAFLVVFLASHIEKSNIPRIVLFICFFFIINSAANCFTGINMVYKKYHWYPYSPNTLEDYFKGRRLFYDRRDAPVFSPKDIQSAIIRYRALVKDGKTTQRFLLPRELGWLPPELEPSKAYDRSIPGGLTKAVFEKNFSDGDKILDWLAQKDYIVKYPPASYFIKEDPDTTIKDGLQEKYPASWQKILNVLKAAQAGKPYYYAYADTAMAGAYNERGNARYKQGDLSGAIVNYNKAIELEPEYGDAYYNLALAYYKQGNWDQAVLNYSKAIAINPKDAESYNDRAVAYFQLKEYRKAWGDVRVLEGLGSAVNPQLIRALKETSGT
jgi:tetratricopeptide (TPR) repeat protein